MKRITLSFISCLLVICVFTQPSIAQHLRASMQNSGFLSLQTDTPYAETYLSIPGKSLQYKKNNHGKYEGAVEVTLLYLRDSNQVAAYDKYLLRSPEINDTVNITFNMLDLRRVTLPDGVYDVQMEVKDANLKEESLHLAQALNLNFRRDSIDFSNIELVDSYSPTVTQNVFSKNGYDIKPYVFNYYPTSINKISFYNEIYNLDKVVGNEDVIITYAVKHSQKDQVANDLFRFSKQKAAAINVVFSEFDITDLPSGNYVVQLQVKNKKNELLGQQSVFFQRSNKNSTGELTNIGLLDVSKTFVIHIAPDSLVYYMKSLSPTAEMYERDYIASIIQKNDLTLMQQFFYNFWKKRNADDPEKEWGVYRNLVAVVEYNYKTAIYHGFETDRGRVFLQYGAPNHMEGSDREPGAYPYEIWQYYKLLSNQSNIHFVFCNADLVSNDYKLIHSEALGELYDPRWRFKVYNTFKDGNGYRDFDIEGFRDTWGSQVDYNYNR
ncbi:MAG: GWxTD domain-containing protein [Chitinophagaceae bacterium]|nr:GWxTD domain-containing protein [Chitinophagaceae bacterium]